MRDDHAYGIDWQRRPTEKEMEARWRITRPPQKSPLRLLILSHDLTGCYTHFWHGRTMPCTGHECEACSASKLPEWHGYLACLQSGTRIRWILEITKGCAAVLDKQFRDARTLRGTVIECGRTSNKSNGRQYVRVTDKVDTMDDVEKAPNLQPILARMWQLREQPLFNHDALPDPLRIASTTDADAAKENREAS